MAVKTENGGSLSGLSVDETLRRTAALIHARRCQVTTLVIYNCIEYLIISGLLTLRSPFFAQEN